MAVEDPPFVLQGDSHPAVVFRHATQALFGSPVTSFSGGISATGTGGGHGIVNAADLAVSQNGTPNMSVNVAAGLAAIRGTEAPAQGVYTFYNDATVNLSIAAADATNPRRDLIIAQVRDSNYSGATLDARLAVVTGTPAGSPADPSLAAFPNALVIARVAVAAAATTVTNANITDLRTRSYAVGGTCVCTSSLRPSSPYEGQLIYETDTDKVLAYNGSAWFIVKSSGSSQQSWTAYTPTWTNLTVGNGTQNHSYYQDGPTVHVRGSLDFGSTTSISGTVTLTLPVVPKSSVLFVGMLRGQDASVSFQRYIGSAEVNTAVWGTQMAPHFHGTGQMASNVPINWTTSDQLVYAVTYEAATAA